jgi:excisionase family DNA binding protein
MNETLTAGEVARNWECSIETVREWADSGRLPAIRTAAGWRLFDRRDVERVALERQQQRCRPGRRR